MTLLNHSHQALFHPFAELEDSEEGLKRIQHAFLSPHQPIIGWLWAVIGSRPPLLPDCRPDR